MFGSTYAVSWSGVDGKRCAGRLDLGEDALSLTGSENGCRIREAIAFREIDSVHLERDRLQILRDDGRPLWIRSLDAPGVLRELAERLAAYAA